MSDFLMLLIILSAALFVLLFIFYSNQDKHVVKPRLLEDEISDALDGEKATLQSVEPVRKSAVALHVPLKRFVLVREFGKTPTKTYDLWNIMGLELIVDGVVLARVIKNGAYKLIDQTMSDGNDIRVRFVIDDPLFPSYELLLWHPTDGGTARAEGPQKAMETARAWFYHIEAVHRHIEKPALAPASSDSEDEEDEEIDVLNSPL